MLRVFGNNKPCAPRPPQMVGMTRCASTPRRNTVEVCASQGPQQARPPPCQCPVVGASRRCTCAVGPISRLCIVYWPDFCHPVHPVHPEVWQLLVRRVPQAKDLDLTRPCPVVGASRRCTCAVGPSSRLCVLAITNPRSCWFSLSSVSWR